MPRTVAALRRTLLLGAALLAAGCAHTKAQRPGTGSLAFRVHWQGQADVDLSVSSPLGEHIDFGTKTAPSGGRLDIDCNYSSARRDDETAGAPRSMPGMPEIERHVCAQPTENIFWPRGEIPPGLYRVLLYIANPVPPPAATDLYELQVIVRGDVKWRQSGRVADLATAHIDQVLEIR